MADDPTTAQGRAMKFTVPRQKADFDCGHCVVAALAAVPYEKAALAIDKLNGLTALEMSNALHELAGGLWAFVTPDEPTKLHELPDRWEAVAVMVEWPETQKRHWVALKDGRVHCPTHGDSEEAEDSHLAQCNVVAVIAPPDADPYEWLPATTALSAGFCDGSDGVRMKQFKERLNQIVDEVSAKVDAQVDAILKAHGVANEMETETKTEGRTDAVTPHSLLLGGKGKAPRSKARSVSHEKDSDVGKHVKSGLPMRDEFGEPVMLPSKRTLSEIGVYFKKLAGWSGINAPLDADETTFWHDHMLSGNTRWVSPDGEEQKEYSGSKVKAILDENTSGGAYLNPDAFDSALVMYPLLHSEIFPYIDLKPLDRGSTVTTQTLGSVTITHGQAEGSALSLFNSDDLINQLSTDIETQMFAIEIGRDALADSAINLGQAIVEVIGQKLAAELDRVVMSGNGSTEPTGILTASGLTTVDAANPTTGPLTVGDFELLMASVSKPYRKTGETAYISNDAMYFKARGVATGPDDARRVFGMDHSSYRLLETAYRIDNNMSAGTIVYGNLKKYRMFRRQGAEIRMIDQGQTLALKNTVLITMRSRHGGRPVDVNAFAKMTNAATQ
jgi:HK97 family phage major capsid protein